MAEPQGSTRDNTDDWLLPEEARPRTFGQLESRVEVAIAVAYASEAAALKVGGAAIEAAKQARRAAEMAERAATHAAAAATTVSAELETGSRPGSTDFDERLRSFLGRASRVSTRLIALGTPAVPGGSSPAQHAIT